MPLGSGLIIRRGGWRPGGGQNGRRGRRRRSGLQWAARPSVGKRASRLCGPCDPPLAVMHWFLAAATGRDTRQEALLVQHLTDFVPVLPLIPHHRCHRRQVLAHPISTSALHCPSRRRSRRGPPLLWQTPRSLLVTPPLAPPIRRGHPPFVDEAGRCGMGFDVSGINHQGLWLWGIRRLWGVGWLWGVGC